MRTTRIGICVLAVFLLSCSSNRPKIDDVTSLDPDGNLDFKTLYGTLTTRIRAYNQKWQDLEKNQWRSAEVKATGGGVAAVSVAAHSVPGAVVGGLAAGLAVINDQFYGTDKQNIAWTKAAHTLQCMRAFSEPLATNASALSSVLLTDSSHEDGDEYARRVLYDALWQVNRTLEDRLRINAISTEPNWNAFATAVKNAGKSDPASKKPGAPQMFAGNTSKEEKFLQQVGRFKEDIASCLAAN